MSRPISAFSLFERATCVSDIPGAIDAFQFVPGASEIEIFQEAEVTFPDESNLDEGENDICLPEERDPHLTEEEEIAAENVTSPAAPEDPGDWQEVRLRQAKESRVDPNSTLLDGLPPFKSDESQNSNIPADCNSPLSFFRLFYANDVLDKFVTETNIYGRKTNASWKDTDKSELMRLFAVVLYLGLYKIPNVRLLWGLPSTLVGKLYGRDFVRKCMSYNRFKSLMWCLHYTNVAVPSGNSQASSQPSDPFASVTPFLEALSTKFSAYGSPSQFIDIDEMCIPFKGRHKARVYNAKKPYKWHFKAYCLNSSDGYLHKFFMYGGAGSRRPPGVSATLHPVEVLTNDRSIWGKNHVLCLDNWYTSIDVIQCCVDRNIHCVGTVRRNRTGIPRSALFPETGQQMARGSYTCRQKNYLDRQIYFTAWQDNKPVHFLSTYEPKYTIYERRTAARTATSNTLEVNGPTIVGHYIKGMRGTDVIDQLVSYYAFLHKSVKWTRRIFTHFLTVAVNNARILRNRKFSEEVPLLDFIHMLIEEIFNENNIFDKVDAQQYEHEKLNASPEGSPSILSQKRKLDESSSASVGAFTQVFHGPRKKIGTEGSGRAHVQGHCVMCSKNSSIFCEICDVALCICDQPNESCFSRFHRDLLSEEG